MNISELMVNQIRVFPVDVVPLGIITTKSCIEKIRDNLSIGEVVPGLPIGGANSIIFIKGAIKATKRLVVISKIEIETRRIILEVAGTSKEANKVYDLLLSAIASISDDIDFDTLRSPLLLVETSRCIAALDFDVEALFNESFTKLLNGKIKKAATNNVAEGQVRPIAAISEITYQIKDENLVKHRITMNPKQFTIAPRAGSPLEERRYVISSPFDTDTHLKLIQSLNKAIGATKKGE